MRSIGCFRIWSSRLHGCSGSTAFLGGTGFLRSIGCFRIWSSRLHRCSGSTAFLWRTACLRCAASLWGSGHYVDEGRIQFTGGMSFRQWIGNWHGYCHAHEEGERGDEGGDGGSDHFDVRILVTVSFKTFRKILVSLIWVYKSSGLKAFVQNPPNGGCSVWGCLIQNVLNTDVYELEGTRT